MSNTPQQYYEGGDLGSYKYISLKEVVQDIMLSSMQEDSMINGVRRGQVLKHSLRAIKELNFDKVVRSVKALELDIGDSLSAPMPVDYISLVRLSKVSEDSKLLPLIENRSVNVAKGYLQDNSSQILFDSNGFAIEADGKNIYTEGFTRREIQLSGRYLPLTDTSKIGKHGDFIEDKDRGVFAFSSDLKDQAIVIEYVSDGLENSSVYKNSLRVLKQLEEPIRAYVFWKLINWSKSASRSDKISAKQDYVIAKRKARRQLSKIKPSDIIKSFGAVTMWA